MTNVVTPQAQARAGSYVTTESARKPVSRDRMIAFLMLLPSVIAIALFVYEFISWNGWASLTDWRGLGIMPQFGPVRFPAGDFVGLDNYAKLFADNRFQIDLRNNGIFTLAFLVVCTVVGLFLAIFLDQHVKGETFFRNVFLFPMALSFVVTGTIWRWIFLDLQWVTNKNLALVCVIIAAAWQMTGFTMAMFIAALRGIPEELREAARVDGATEVGIYRHVVLPLINPIILSALIILGHISLKIFDLVYVMTSGSPTLGYATDMPSIYMFQLAFKDDLFARSAAISMIMLVFVAIVIVPYLWSNYRSEKEAEA
jgi:glucose/mannose transport system permease protein